MMAASSPLSHLLTLSVAILALCVAAEPIYKATPVTTESTTAFDTFIEGAAVSPSGDVYAVDYTLDFDGTKLVGTSRSTLARVVATESNGIEIAAPFDSQLFITARTGGGNWNGGRFFVDNSGETVVYLADQSQKKIVLAKPMPFPAADSNGAFLSDFCKGSPSKPMIAPNDIAVASNGRIFISGQNYLETGSVGDGDLWTCSPSGVATRLGLFGRTNGVELSPDEKTLYLSEAFNEAFAPKTNKIWSFKVDASAGKLVPGRALFVDFGTLDGTGNVDVDGMRTDVKGNLYVTRNGGGEVVIFSPAGKVLGRIKLSFTSPTNLEFGGPDGRTLYVVGRCGIDTPYATGVGCVDAWRAPFAGNAFTKLNQQKK